MVPLAWRVLLWLFPPEFEYLPITRESRARQAGGAGAAERYRMAHAHRVRHGDRHVAGLALSWARGQAAGLSRRSKRWRWPAGSRCFCLACGADMEGGGAETSSGAASC